jgi:uncharacterized DUF497 family protein
MYYNNNVEGEIEYEWFESKRQEVLSNVVIEPDNRQDYGEDRFLAYGMVEGERLCLCFTLRKEKVHLITILKMHKKQWGKHYGKAENHDGTSNTEKI